MATTTAVAFTATAAFATVFMTVIVAMTAAATVVVVIVVMIVRAVNVAMSQFFFGRFARSRAFSICRRKADKRSSKSFLSLGRNSFLR